MSPPINTGPVQDSLEVRVARIDERTEAMQKKLEERDKTYVTQDQFWPVKTIVYAGAGLVLLAFMSAVVALVIIKT